jgi:uncharacterized protein (TIGR02391 family)
MIALRPRVSLQPARDRLTERVEHGRALVGSILKLQYNDQLTELSNEAITWSEINHVLLSELFEDESIPQSYPQLPLQPTDRVGILRAEVSAWANPLLSAIRYLEVLLARLNALSGAVDLTGTGPGATVTVYELHPRIEEVSGSLLRDGHFKSAVLEAYICVIDEVKSKSGLAEDGDHLMNLAFGCENRRPVVQVNNLATGAERDEQKGYMYLFKGIVALRNSKAHSNTLFNSPERTHEYLALASVLLRILEISQVNAGP